MQDQDYPQDAELDRRRAARAAKPPRTGLRRYGLFVLIGLWGWLILPGTSSLADVAADLVILLIVLGMYVGFTWDSFTDSASFGDRALRGIVCVLGGALLAAVGVAMIVGSIQADDPGFLFYGGAFGCILIGLGWYVASSGLEG